MACFVPAVDRLRSAFWSDSSLILHAEGWIHEQWIVESLHGSHQHPGRSSSWLDLRTDGFQNFGWRKEEARISHGRLAAADISLYAWAQALLSGTQSQRRYGS